MHKLNYFLSRIMLIIKYPLVKYRFINLLNYTWGPPQGGPGGHGPPDFTRGGQKMHLAPPDF